MGSRSDKARKVCEARRRFSVFTEPEEGKRSREEFQFPNGAFSENDDDSKKPYPDAGSISEM